MISRKCCNVSNQTIDSLLYIKRLVMEAANQLGSLNGKMSKVHSQLDTIAENRFNAIKKFNADQLTVDEKTELANAYDGDKAAITDELAI